MFLIYFNVGQENKKKNICYNETLKVYTKKDVFYVYDLSF